MLKSRSRSVLSRFLQLCRNRGLLQQPTISRCSPPYHHGAASHHRLEAVRRRLFSFFSDSIHAIKRSPPLIISSRRRETQQLVAPWHHDPRKVALVTALLAAGASLAAHLRYSETVPFTGRTHLVVLSHREARERDQAVFAEEKKKHASNILSPGHPHTIRVRHIAREIITAAHTALAIKQEHMQGGSSVDLDWTEGLEWEVIVVRDSRIIACTGGAGKILISSGALDYFRSDAEIAAIIAHEVAHIVARHTSEMISNWFPLKLLLRRHETEADHIGMILFAVAGFDPRLLPMIWDKLAKLERDSRLPECLHYLTKTHPPTKTRSQLLSQPEVMEEALEFYSHVKPRVQPKYPKTKEWEKQKHGMPWVVYIYRNQIQRNYRK